MDVLLSSGDKIDQLEIMEGCFVSSKPLMRIIHHGDQEIWARMNESGCKNYNCFFETDENLKNGTMSVKTINHKCKEIILSVSKEYYDNFFATYFSRSIRAR